MKLIRRAIILAAMVMMLCVTACAFEIQSYSTTVTVGSDNSWFVSETILVDFTGSNGAMTRVIPLTTPDGKEADVRRLDVTGSDYKIKRDDDKITITLGKEGNTLAAGAFGISYEYDIGYDFDESEDRFSFQLIDANLGADVTQFSYTIVMPAQFDHRAFSVTSGYFGKISSPDYTVSGNNISGTMKLMAYESIDVEIELPNGYFTEAVYQDTIADGIETVAPFAAAILLAVAMAMLFTKCKNPAVSYGMSANIPQGLTPTDMMYLINGSITVAQMVSLIPYWASAGYLIIKQIPTEGIVLTRAAAMGSDRKEYERMLFDSMFPKGSNLRLKGPNIDLQSAMRAAKKGLENYWKQADVFREPQRKYLLLAVGLPVIACMLTAIGCGNGVYWGRMPAIVLIVVFALVGIAACGICMACGWLSKKQGIRRNWWGLVLGAAWALLLVINLMNAGASLFCGGTLLLSQLAGFIVGLYLWDMTPRTELGLELLETSLALRDYIKYASDSDVREITSSGREMYYYELLPYAGAFGLESIWADKFMNLRIMPPIWFETSDSGKYITPLVFLARLEERMEYVKTAFVGSTGSRALTVVYIREASRNLFRQAKAKVVELRAKAAELWQRTVKLWDEIKEKLHRRDEEQ